MQGKYTWRTSLDRKSGNKVSTWKPPKRHITRIPKTQLTTCALACSRASNKSKVPMNSTNLCRKLDLQNAKSRPKSSDKDGNRNKIPEKDLPECQIAQDSRSQQREEQRVLGNKLYQIWRRWHWKYRKFFLNKWQNMPTRRFPTYRIKMAEGYQLGYLLLFRKQW